MQFASKVVLVTGAQQGIGRAMALEFAAAGADVAINWLDDDAAAHGAHPLRTFRRRYEAPSLLPWAFAIEINSAGRAAMCMTPADLSSSRSP